MAKQKVFLVDDDTDILTLNLNLFEDTGILIMYSNGETGISMPKGVICQIVRGEDKYGLSY